MNAGEKTHRLLLQIKSITQDSEGNAVETWNPWRTVWCQPLPKDGREYYRLSVNNSEITEVFKMDYIGGVNAHQRVKFKGRYFEIIGDPINEGERNDTLLITCKGAV
jgi:SPP1 family predicted phage head-tail adaptor